jgi:hypothetical protein
MPPHDKEEANDVAHALMREITRVRDEVMPAYLEIGESGRVALELMRLHMDAAVRALAYQDGPACIQLLVTLKGFSS